MPPADASTENACFLTAHAAPGRIGLAGGTHPIDRTIRKVQRGLARDAAGSAWSHAF